MKLSATPEYRAWDSMINRCYNSKNSSYNYYGGRGIKVCERWLISFADFLVDVGKKPVSNLSLDRINNDEDYKPGNVRWATKHEQQLNQRPRHSRSKYKWIKSQGNIFVLVIRGIYVRTFETLDEAVKYRDEVLLKLGIS